MATRGWEHVTADQVVAAATPAPSKKYRNVRVEFDGQWFDSKDELNYWLLLRDRERRGEIQRLRHHVAFPLLCPAATLHDSRIVKIAVCSYEADFVYLEAGELHVVDVKQPATRAAAVYRLKRKWLELQDGIVIEEVGT